MTSRRKRMGVEAGAAAAILGITLATWAAAGVFSPSKLLHSFSEDATVSRATRQVALPSPAQFDHDPRDLASSMLVDPGILEALAAPTDAPARVTLPLPPVAPVITAPVLDATVDPAAGRLTASTPATPVAAPIKVTIDAGPVLAPVTNTVNGLVATVGGVLGGVLGGQR
jgi:hypothetical protein